MVITLALKKTSTKNWLDKLTANLIKWRTHSQYFHVEMIVGDKWISTNPEAGAVYIHELLPLNDNYDYFDIKIHGSKVKKMMKFAESQVGKKYDWKGILLSQTINLAIDDKDKWFCSEIMAEMLKSSGYLNTSKDSNQYSPETIYQLVKPPQK